MESSLTEKLPPLNDVDTEYTMQLFGDLAYGLFGELNEATFDILKKCIIKAFRKYKDELNIKVTNKRAEEIKTRLYFFQKWGSIILSEINKVEEIVEKCCQVPPNILLRSDSTMISGVNVSGEEVLKKQKHVSELRDKLHQKLAELCDMKMRQIDVERETKLLDYEYDIKSKQLEELLKIEKEHGWR